MSEVNASDLRIIDSAAEILPLYEMGAGDQPRTGIEIEMAFFDPDKPGLPPMNVAQNKIVQDKGNEQCGEQCVRNEPSSDMLEVSSVALGPEHLATVMRNMNGKVKFLTDIAAETGLKRSWFQEQPAATAAQLFKNVVDVDRYQAFFAPPRADMMDIATYFFVCKSDQVSVSYRDPDHMLENVRRLYFLAPFLFLLTDNSSGFDEGKAFSGHAGMRHRASLKDRGVYPPYLFTAKTGADYLRAHVDHVMNNPLFVYYKQTGEMVRLPSGTWTSFNKLREEGLNTATNYFFAQSVLWPDVKIAALKNAAGEVTSHRYEARMFGVGIHQHQTALLITAGLAFNQSFADKTDALLKSFGFCVSDPQRCGDILATAYKNAREHGGKFFDIAYGTGQMQDFARKFADLLEEAYAAQNFSNELTPALQICRTGCTDGKVNRMMFPTLDKAMEFQRTYDPAYFANPNFNAQMIFDISGCGSKKAASA